MINAKRLLVSLLIVLLAICPSIWAQSEYPKKMISQTGDTIVAFTVPQVYRLDLLRLDLEECQEVAASRLGKIMEANYLVDQQKSLIDLMEDRKKYGDSLQSKSNELIDEQGDIIAKQGKKLNRKDWGLKILGGTTVVSLGVLVGVLLSN